MTIVSGGRNAVVKKLTPNGHLSLAWRPSSYPKTAQQRKFGEVARSCGIKRGIGKEALVRAMIDCVGPKLRRGA